MATTMVQFAISQYTQELRFIGFRIHDWNNLWML